MLLSMAIMQFGMRMYTLFSFRGHESIANLRNRNYGKGRALYTGILTLKDGKITAQVD